MLICWFLQTEIVGMRPSTVAQLGVRYVFFALGKLELKCIAIRVT